MFKLNNVKFVDIARIFQFKDEENKILIQGIQNEFMDGEGNKRVLNLEKDEVCFFFRICVQDVDSGKNVWMSGFDKCGETLFGKCAKEMFEEKKVDIENLTEMLEDKIMDVIISGYTNVKSKKDKGCLWTIESILNIYEEVDSESDLEEKEESISEEQQT
eukprot:90204_1